MAEDFSTSLPPPTITQEQLELFRDLPPEQQQQVAASQGLTVDEFLAVGSTLANFDVRASDAELDSFPDTPQLAATSTHLSQEGVENVNRFLSNNAKVAFVVAFLTLLEEMQETKLAEKEAEIMGMEQIMVLAESAAEQTLAIAEEQAKIFETEAVAAIVSGAVALSSVGLTLGARAYGKKMYKRELKNKQADLTEFKRLKTLQDNGTIEPDDLKNLQGLTKKYKNPEKLELDIKEFKANRYSTISTHAQQMIQLVDIFKQVSSQSTEAVSKFIQAALTITKGQEEAIMKLIEGYQQIAQKAMASAGESYRSEQEAINQLLAALDKLAATMKDYDAFGRQ